VPLKELGDELARLARAGCLNTEGLYFLAVGLQLGQEIAAAAAAAAAAATPPAIPRSKIA
jgi:hypothetical protein